MKSAPMRSYVWLALMMMPLCVCAKKYSAEPITAHVVDADTQEPIEGWWWRRHGYWREASRAVTLRE
jgi:hypothetical protein